MHKKKFLLKGKFFFVSCRGSLSVQFLLGFFLLSTFIMLFASMALTLTMSAVTQYITYTTGRHLFLGDGTLATQRQSANSKYHSLRTHPHLKKLFTQSLFQIKNTLEVGNGLGVNKRFTVNSGVPNLFYGAWTDFTPNILEVETLWGSTKSGEGFFHTIIGSYLGREPTSQECIGFIEQRWNLIKQKHIEYGGSPIPANAKYIPSMDNGC